MLDVETFLLEMSQTGKGPTWKRLPHFFLGHEQKRRKRLDVETFSSGQGDVETFPGAIP